MKLEWEQLSPRERDALLRHYLHKGKAVPASMAARANHAVEHPHRPTRSVRPAAMAHK